MVDESRRRPIACEEGAESSIRQGASGGGGAGGGGEGLWAAAPVGAAAESVTQSGRSAPCLMRAGAPQAAQGGERGRARGPASAPPRSMVDTVR